MSDEEERMTDKIARMLLTGSGDEVEEANKAMKETLSVGESEKLDQLISHPTPNVEPKEPIGLQTGTLLDKLFLDNNGESLGGIPMVGQLGIVGLAGSGKSILIQEVAVRVAGNGQKVLLVTSEDAWFSYSSRFDLQARLKQKADILGLDWEKICSHLFVLDVVTFSELKKWWNFAKVYRYLIKKENIDLVLIDSVTLLESSRGALKHRLHELSNWNQVNGVTAIYINQRATEDINKYSSAGGIGLSHNLDINICIDHGKVWGAPMKADLDKKQGEWVFFIRVMDCRLGRFDGRHHETIITEKGFLELVEVEKDDTK